MLVCLVGCAAPIHLPDIDRRPAASYASFREHDGLRLAIDPYLTTERMVTALGLDLGQQGILPVLVVLENGTGVVLSLERESVALVHVVHHEPEGRATDGAGAFDRKVARAKRTERAFGEAGVWSVAAVLPFGFGILIPAGAVLVPTGIVMEHAGANRARIRNHLVAVELGSRTLHPAQATRGFVYFKLDDAGVDHRTLAVRVRARNVADGTTWEIAVPLIGHGMEDE